MRSLAARLSVVIAALLVVALGVTVVAAYQVVLRTSLASIDGVLIRERDDLAKALPSIAQASAADPQALRSALLDYLAVHPSSSVHLSGFTIDGATTRTAGGPPRLADAARRDVLPTGTPDRIETVDTPVGLVRVLQVPVVVDDRQVAAFRVYGDEQSAREAAAAAAGRLTAVAAIVGLAAVLVLLLVVRRTTRGLRHLADDVASTHEPAPHSGVRVPGTQDEVHALALEINDMLGRLRRADAERAELFATLGHELRTPLAVAQGHAELLASGAAPDPQRSSECIEAELRRSARMLDDLFLLARAEHPRSSRSPMTPQQIADELSLRLIGLGLEANVHRVGTSPATVDADALLQAVSNLVINAAVHGGDDVSIDVTIEGGDGSLVVTVRDDGPGIPEQVVRAAGEPFVTAGERGTGLGLAVVHAVARAHGGDVTFRTQPGRTEVMLTVPLDGTTVGGWRSAAAPGTLTT